MFAVSVFAVPVFAVAVFGPMYGRGMGGFLFVVVVKRTGTRGSSEVERNCENSAVLTYDAHGATQQQSAAISPLSEHSLIGSRDVPPHTTPLSDLNLTRWVGGRH